MPEMTGRKAFVELLIDEGVTHLFGNPGTTELPIMEVLPEYPQLRYILGLQEAVVMAMADGFCRASNRITAANVHAAPGLNRGSACRSRFSMRRWSPSRSPW
jgi:benzoylformate decarboxylase